MLICKSCNAVRPPFGWPTDALLLQLVDGGRYKVNRRLGAGGFGAVYEVIHTLVDQKRAMKVMDKQLVGTPEVQRRFIDEWDILDKLRHPNIVRCFEIGILPESRQPFMLLELLKGRNLFDEVWPRSANFPNRVSPVRTARLGWQIASALTVAHARGMLHRDLKPDNVLLIRDENGVEQAKVIDFGIAKILGAATVDRKTSRIVGTPEYMAPEQFSPGKELDGRLDLWQLGAVLFFISTGWPPYTAKDDDPFSVYRAMRLREGQGPQPSEQHQPMAACPGLDTLIGSLLSTDPDDRPESARVVLETITSLFENGELDDGQPPPAYNTGYGNAGYAGAGQGAANAHRLQPLSQELDPIRVAERQPAQGDEGMSSAQAVARIPLRKTRNNSPRVRGATASNQTRSTQDPGQAQNAGQRTKQHPSPQPARTSATQTSHAQATQAQTPTPQNAGRRTILVAVVVGVLAVALTATALLVPWDEVLSGGDKYTEPTFKRLNTGRFSMGSRPEEVGRADDETRHEVSITIPIEVQTTEVTQAQWTHLMDQNPAGFQECGGDCPVENVSWWDALEYLNRLSSSKGMPQCYELSDCIGAPGVNFRCAQVTFEGLTCRGYRLPTEAEWEYFARAGTQTAFYAGNLAPTRTECEPIDPDLDEVAWFCGNAGGATHPVGRRKPNAWGLHDTIGNVSEWVWDWNFGDYSDQDVEDPLGPSKGAGRSTRGGSWLSLGRECRAANRGYENPEDRKDSLGLRPVRSLK